MSNVFYNGSCYDDINGACNGTFEMPDGRKVVCPKCNGTRLDLTKLGEDLLEFIEALGLKVIGGK